MSQSVTAPNQGASSTVPNKASEVGWLFVPQYYTFMNKDPSRLHCFYTKKSTMVHGTENEDVHPSVGQQEIHQKVQSLGFQDTKVYVSNVDSQSSADGGIVIQVLGEMSNKGGKWRKFAQTFFLAQQPNGFYVLNDIFRYLNDEDVDEDDEDDVDNGAGNQTADAGAAKGAVDSSETPSVSVADTPAARDATVSKETSSSHEKKSADASSPSNAPAQDTSSSAHPASQAASSATASATESSTAAPAQSQGELNKASSAKAKATPAEASTAPPKPAAPKTWANLAASGANRWGNTASEARGLSETPAASAAATTPNESKPSAPGHAGKTGKPQQQQQQQQQHGHVFVKNVPTSQVSQDDLRQALETQFGSMKECHLNMSKGFAFVEFVDADAARRAISASSNHGGVRVGEASVLVEKRRPQERGSGGGRGRGGHRGNHASHA